MAQLEFAWKLLAYAEDGNIDLEKLDVGMTFEEKGMMLVLRDKVFDSYDDLVLACQNNLGVAFGAAAITLNRAREEANVALPQSFHDDRDHFVALVYQIRNAFAHDIAEPRWCVRRPAHRRRYQLPGIDVDLSSIEIGEPFTYESVGGPEVMMALYELYDDGVLRS